MPPPNCFRHQPYVAWDTPPIPTTTESVTPDQTADVDVGHVLQELRIRHVILVHGTFVGDDPFGLAQKLDDLTDAVPPMWRPLLKTVAAESWGRVLRKINQAIGDRVMGETGSFRDDYLTDFRELVRTNWIEIDRFDWSSGNDHVARTQAAVALFNRLNDLFDKSSDDRIMLWGHSHAGNVFALLSNLLANEPQSVNAFFQAGAPLGNQNHGWQQAHDRLINAETPHPLARQLSLVTFGTPVRYGWDPAGYAKLLHIVFHRAANPKSPWLAKPALPQSVDEILSAAHGDWVQSFGIAGTDLAPVDRILRDVHRQLNDLLETNLPVPDVSTALTWVDRLPEKFREQVRSRLSDWLVLRERWNVGPRVPASGNATWLFDYGHSEKAKFGHGVYTKRSWLKFHATRIAEWLRTEWES